MSGRHVGQRPQSSSALRFTAGAAGFLTFIQLSNAVTGPGDRAEPFLTLQRMSAIGGKADIAQKWLNVCF
jgi:hypothetical protein